MGLKYWWILFIWVIGIALFWVVRYLLRKKRRISQNTDKVPIAHSNRLTQLPAYQRALKRYDKLVTLACIIISAALILSIAISARPVAVTQITPAQKGRDIMLCLDVSGSLLRVDAKIINRFSILVNNFSGQRFGLTIFNSSAISVIPLTDDYVFINEQLKVVGDALAEQSGNEFERLTSGTLAAFDKGTSLVGDGVTSCMNNLGPNHMRRSQSVILATDNESNGTPIIELEQAIGLAKKNNVRIYAIDPGSEEGERADDHRALRQLAEDTAGDYHNLNNDEAIAAIIDGISQQEAKYAASTPVIGIADKPKLFAYGLLLLVTGTLVVLWRLKL